jgi:hypothetical protein
VCQISTHICKQCTHFAPSSLSYDVKWAYFFCTGMRCVHSVGKSRTTLEDNIERDFVWGMWTRLIQFRKRRIWDKWVTLMDSNVKCYFINEDNILGWLTFWHRNYFFLFLAHHVYKIWIIQEPNMLELWNKLHFEVQKKRRLYTMFKIFDTYVCWINIYNETLEVSGAVREL